MRRDHPRVSVIVPCRNEAHNLRRILPDIAAVHPPVHEIIVVDGHSVDDTVATARRTLRWAQVIGQTRTGKGNAVRCGIAAASGDILIIADADCTHIDQIPTLVAALADADLAIVVVPVGPNAHGGRVPRSTGVLARRTAALLAHLAAAAGRVRAHRSRPGLAALRAGVAPLLEPPATDTKSSEAADAVWGLDNDLDTLLISRAAAAGLITGQIALPERGREPAQGRRAGPASRTIARGGTPRNGR